jgi:hypothetical protein
VSGEQRLMAGAVTLLVIAMIGWWSLGWGRGGERKVIKVATEVEEVLSEEDEEVIDETKDHCGDRYDLVRADIADCRLGRYKEWVGDFDGYVFTTYVDHKNDVKQIVRIPEMAEKTVENSELVMDYSGESRGSPEFQVVDGRLYITFGDYMLNGTLYVMDSAKEVPRLVVKEALSGGFLRVIDATNPQETFKLLQFGDGDVCRYWGSLYYYQPEDDYTELLTSIELGCDAGNDFYGLTSDNLVLLGEKVESDSRSVGHRVFGKFSGMNLVEQINGIKIEPRIHNFGVQAIISREQMPEDVGHVRYNETTNKLYLFGSKIWTFDLGSRELKLAFDMEKFLNEDGYYETHYEVPSWKVEKRDEFVVEKCLSGSVANCHTVFNLETGSMTEVVE